MTKLSKISIKDLAKSSICPGHLFLQTNSGRKFYLMKPGIFVDKKFLMKHMDLSTDFELNPVVDEAVQDNFYRVLKEFNYLYLEMETRDKCVDIIKMFKEVFSTESHFLNFAIPCFQNFNSISQVYLQQVSDCDFYLLRKAIYSAAFSVIISFCNGIYQPEMIRDIYNVTLAMDFGLCSKDYSFYVAQACNEENKIPGTGKDWLVKKGASQNELALYLSHPENSFKFFDEKKINLKHMELSQIVLYQHELASGGGFPRGIRKGLVSSWESVVILADHLVEITGEYDFENRVIDYLLNFYSEKLSELPLNKVYKRLCLNLNEIEDDEEMSA